MMHPRSPVQPSGPARWQRLLTALLLTFPLGEGWGQEATRLASPGELIDSCSPAWRPPSRQAPATAAEAPAVDSAPTRLEVHLELAGTAERSLFPSLDLDVVSGRIQLSWEDTRGPRDGWRATPGNEGESPVDEAGPWAGIPQGCVLPISMPARGLLPAVHRWAALFPATVGPAPEAEEAESSAPIQPFAPFPPLTSPELTWTWQEDGAMGVPSFSRQLHHPLSPSLRGDQSPRSLLPLPGFAAAPAPPW